MVVDKAFCAFFEKNAKLLAIFFVVWKMFRNFAHRCARKLTLLLVVAVGGR